MLPAWLDENLLRIGSQFDLDPYQVIYREEGNNLIICGLTRRADTRPHPQRFFQLWRILRGIFQCSHPGFQALRMLVLSDSEASPAASKGHKLERILRKKGAVDIYWDNHNWLSLSATVILRCKSASAA